MQFLCKLFGKSIASEAGDSVTQVVLSVSRTKVALSLYCNRIRIRVNAVVVSFPYSSLNQKTIKP